MIATILKVIFNVLIFTVIIDVVLSYILSPYHPVRSTMDKIDRQSAAAADTKGDPTDLEP